MQLTLSRDDCALGIARAHAEIDDGLLRAYRIFSAEDRIESADVPIRILEVSEDAISAGILPVGFGSDPGSGIPYPLVVVQVTPSEFERLLADDLHLPEGWTLAEEPLWTRGRLA